MDEYMLFISPHVAAFLVTIAWHILKMRMKYIE